MPKKKGKKKALPEPEPEIEEDVRGRARPAVVCVVPGACVRLVG